MWGTLIEATMPVHCSERRRPPMPFIHVRVVEGVFTALQKREIVERLTEAMVAVQGEGMRQLTWCVVEEVPSGAWGIGGQAVTADDIRAIARGANEEEA
jgi:4-oxalocrotonate tautomerase